MFANSLVALMLMLGTAPAHEHIVRIDVPNHDAVYTLQHQIDLAIIDAGQNAITAYADDSKVAQLRGLGYAVTILVDDYQTLTAPLGTYATYAEVCSTMRYLAQQYPSITKLETLGFSVRGRPILIMKVTSNPQQEANRPRIRLNGLHHGYEKIATEITLAFLKYLCERYDTNALVHTLVDTRETWIDPIFNVDGHIDSVRENANGVDLNRDYGYEWGNEGGSTSPYSQVETRAMREHAERHVINLEYSYHSAAAYVNYLWDNHPSQAPDSSWVQPMSQRYADSTYGSGTQLDTINGYAWYEVHGSCQDNTYGNYGGLAWTIETARPSNRSAVNNICNANRRALLEMIHVSGWGVQGLVHDSLTGAPLFAQVAFTEPYRWTTFTQYSVGDFHKSLPPGTYTLKVSSNGYVPRTLSNVVVPETGAVSLDVPLVRPEVEQPNYAQKPAIVVRDDMWHSYSDWVIRALGEPDGNYYSVGPNPSYVVFDVDPFVPVRDRVGNDISVYATGSYTLAASSNWQGPWTALGSGTGNASFDLGPSGLDSARYLKVTGSSAARIDAIGYLGQPLTAVEAPELARRLTIFRVGPNPSNRQAVIELGFAAGVTADVMVRDVAGRAVRMLARRTELSGCPRLTWDLRDDAGRNVPNGVYFCAVSAGSGSASRKIVVER